LTGPLLLVGSSNFGTARHGWSNSYLIFINIPHNDGVGDLSRSLARDLPRLESMIMLNPQLSPHRSAADQPDRSAWTRTSTYTPSRTPDLLSQVRRVPRAYLGLAGLVLLLVGLMTHAGWLVVGIGVGLMIAAVVTSAARPRTKVMYWRGRRIELTEESSTRSNVRRWLGRR
jgi:hypothetical protein